MVAELSLALPWAPAFPERVGGLLVRRGEDDVLSYDDGVTLQVRVLDPARYASAVALVREAEEQEAPGWVVLAAGDVPASWQAVLRKAGLSFVDVSGLMDIDWPGVRVSPRNLAAPVAAEQSPVPLVRGHTLVLEELLIAAAGGARPTLGALAKGAGVSLAAVSRAVAQLGEHGLAGKEQAGSQVVIALTDQVAAAGLLAAQTAWPGDEVASGSLPGTDARDPRDLAAAISARAASAGTDLAVTGRTGAAFLAGPGPDGPGPDGPGPDPEAPEVHCWVDPGGQTLAAVARLLGLRPAQEGEPVVTLSADTWRTGVHRRSQVSSGDWTATVAHPVRVWCDLQGEPEAAELAGWLWQQSARPRGRAAAGRYGPRSQSKR